MKIAMLNRDMETSHFGGDIVHVKTLSRFLEKKDLLVTFNPPLDRLDYYDIIHCWHINFGFSLANLEAALYIPGGIPIVLTTIYYESDKHGTYFPQQLDYLEAVEKRGRVVSYSLPETAGIRSCTGYTGLIEVIPPGVEEMFHAPNGGNNRDLNVLTLTARNAEKNTDKIAKISLELGYNYTSIGGGLTREEVTLRYKYSKVFVQASEVECYGLTILEALAAGCRVLATKYSKGAQTIPGLMLIDPLDMENMRFHIKRAMELPEAEWNWTPNNIARLMKWEYAAFRYNAIYEECLRHH